MRKTSERKQVYTIEEIAPLIPDYHPEYLVKSTQIDLDGDLVYCDSLRLLTFKKDGFVCKGCGLKGAFFGKEKGPNDARYHLELYGLKDGKEVLMTKDHRIPRAKGGKNIVENLDCMCQPCNLKKGTSLPGNVSSFLCNCSVNKSSTETPM